MRAYKDHRPRNSLLGGFETARRTLLTGNPDQSLAPAQKLRGLWPVVENASNCPQTALAGFSAVILPTRGHCINNRMSVHYICRGRSCTRSSRHARSIERNHWFGAGVDPPQEGIPDEQVAFQEHRNFWVPNFVSGLVPRRRPADVGGRRHQVAQRGRPGRRSSPAVGMKAIDLRRGATTPRRRASGRHGAGRVAQRGRPSRRRGGRLARPDAHAGRYRPARMDPSGLALSHIASVEPLQRA